MRRLTAASTGPFRTETLSKIRSPESRSDRECSGGRSNRRNSAGRFWLLRSVNRMLTYPGKADLGADRLRDRRFRQLLAVCGSPEYQLLFAKGGLRRISLHKTGVAVRQVHRKEVDPALDPGDLRRALRQNPPAHNQDRAAAARTPRAAQLRRPAPNPYNGDPASVAVLIATPQTGYAEGDRANRYAQTLCPM
jgi:hypothetical protein